MTNCTLDHNNELIQPKEEKYVQNNNVKDEQICHRKRKG